MLEPVDTAIDQEVLERTAKRFADKGIILPTFEQMRHPETTPPFAERSLAKPSGLSYEESG